MLLSKNITNKKCAPKLILFNEKKIWKNSNNFWHRKFTLKVKRLGDFALFDSSPLTQFSKSDNFLWLYWFLGKNLSNFDLSNWKTPQPILPYCKNLHNEFKNYPVSQSCFEKIDLVISVIWIFFFTFVEMIFWKISKITWIVKWSWWNKENLMKTILQDGSSTNLKSGAPTTRPG